MLWRSPQAGVQPGRDLLHAEPADQAGDGDQAGGAQPGLLHLLHLPGDLHRPAGGRRRCRLGRPLLLPEPHLQHQRCHLLR